MAKGSAPKIWKTKDGRHIPVEKLEDDHLKNIEQGLVNGILYGIMEGATPEISSHRERARTEWLQVVREEIKRRSL